MIGFALTDDQRALQASARAFAVREVAPLAERIYRERPADGWPMVRPVFEAGVALGLTRGLIPEADGGLGLTCLDQCIILEELGAADVGFAGDFFALVSTMPLMMARGGRSEQNAAFVERLLAHPGLVLAGAQSEPDVAGSELMMGGMDPAQGPKLRANRDGDGWVLNGVKSAFITNARVADEFFILARTAPDQPAMTGLTVFHLPRSTPGLTIGRATELIGWPLSQHAELSFDSVHLPDSARVGPVGGAAMLFARIPEMPVCLAACFVGLARAAHEYALDYARQRQSGGRPIATLPTVAAKLAEQAIELRAARLMVWAAAAECETDPMAAAMISAPAAKAKAVDVAIANAGLAVEVLGGYGVTREYRAGRMLNDAWVGWSCDFTRDVLHQGIARALLG